MLKNIKLDLKILLLILLLILFLFSAKNIEGQEIPNAVFYRILLNYGIYDGVEGYSPQVTVDANSCYSTTGGDTDGYVPDPRTANQDYYIDTYQGKIGPMNTSTGVQALLSFECRGLELNDENYYNSLDCIFSCYNPSSKTIRDEGDVCTDDSQCSDGLRCLQLDSALVKVCQFVVPDKFDITDNTQQGSDVLSKTIAGYGTSCQLNYAECPENQVNFLQAVEDGLIELNGSYFDIEAFRYGITKYFEDQALNLCVSKDIKSLIPLLVPYEYASYEEINLPNGDWLNKAIYARYCPSDKIAMESISPVRRSEAWACCPAGHVYVTPSSASIDKQLYYSGICCPTNGARPGDTDYPLYGNFNTTQCYSDNNGTVIPGLTGINNTMDPSINGIKLGDKVTIKEDFSESYKTCPYNEGCVVVPEGTTDSESIDIQGGKLYLSRSDNLEKSGGNEYSCLKCYADGEPIAITSGESQELILCNAANSEDGSILKKEPLKNNSITDTLAWLAAQGDANKDFIKQCREQGGLPTAIGCLDTTPIGIITGLIRIALGVMGGVALVQLILVGINYQRGNEAEIKKAREQLVATLTGLALLVFSVLILRIIGVNVLDILPAGTL